MELGRSLFSIVVNMSLTGSIVIVAVMIVRLCLRRAPKMFSYLLWAVVLLRLLCPFSAFCHLRWPTAPVSGSADARSWAS